MRHARRWLYIVHRWIGIGTCLLFAMWFISGVVMMYVAFPQLTDAERWMASPPIAWDKVQVNPDRAMEAAGLKRYPRDLRLAMLNEEPVYRLQGGTASARPFPQLTATPSISITSEQALTVARHHPDAVRPELKETVERDQWSVTARFDPLRPLYLVALGDPAGTELYISSRNGEIALDTTRTSGSGTGSDRSRTGSIRPCCARTGRPGGWWCCGFQASAW